MDLKCPKVHGTCLYIKESYKFPKINLKLYSLFPSQIIILKLSVGNFWVASGNRHLAEKFAEQYRSNNFGKKLNFNFELNTLNILMNYIHSYKTSWKEYFFTQITALKRNATKICAQKT